MYVEGTGENLQRLRSLNEFPRQLNPWPRPGSSFKGSFSYQFQVFQHLLVVTSTQFWVIEILGHPLYMMHIQPVSEFQANIQNIRNFLKLCQSLSWQSIKFLDPSLSFAFHPSRSTGQLVHALLINDTVLLQETFSFVLRMKPDPE